MQVRRLPPAGRPTINHLELNFTGVGSDESHRVLFVELVNTAGNQDQFLANAWSECTVFMIGRKTAVSLEKETDRAAIGVLGE
jgi:hypothetical protein